MKLHVVSFQVPYPPDYGGLIDVYYKLKALKEAGCTVTLHTYRYRAEEQPRLHEVADTVYYYERFTGWRSQLSLLPYIVYSRRSGLLLQRLCEDDAPILFEGLHTCYFLSHPRLRNRQKWVRMHNVEHAYYRSLAQCAVSWKEKCFFRLEAWRLRRYESVLLYADKVFAITAADAAWFTRKYPPVLTYCLPCFFDDSDARDSTQADFSRHDSSLPADVAAHYILYHGNLSVLENRRVASYILGTLLPGLPAGLSLVIAGKGPDKSLCDKISAHPNAFLIANPSAAEMERLIAEAHINLLLTFQNTGIKLKLLYALTKGRGHCLVNSLMIADDVFRGLCTVADDEEAQLRAIRDLHLQSLSAEALQHRREVLRSTGYDNRVTLILR